MKKKLIPHYYIDEDSNEPEIIKGNIGFAISPYLEELPVSHQKIFNSLLGNERVYTERMLKEAIIMLRLTTELIRSRLNNIEFELSNMPPPDTTKPAHVYYVLKENYQQQLKKIDELEQIFVL